MPYIRLEATLAGTNITLHREEWVDDERWSQADENDEQEELAEELTKDWIEEMLVTAWREVDEWEDQ